MLLLLYFYTFTFISAQPCAAPVSLIGTTMKSGVCTPPVPAASLLPFPYASLGTSTLNAVKFSVAFWFQPPGPPVNGGSTYGILRVSVDASDTTPTTTDGIRFAVYFSLDSSNKGFYLGYSESPSDPILYTDITQMSTTFTGTWMYIYAGLDYTTGEMKISTWEMKFTFWQQKIFSASKVNFNTALTATTQIDVLYWGSQNSFCGNIKKLFWMPNYYETVDENIFKLAYYLEGKTNTNLYIYRFDTVTKNKVTNMASAGQVTLQQNMQFTYYEMDLTYPVLTLPTAIWTTTTNSYSFAAYIQLSSLPQFASDLILFQRVSSATTNLFSIKLAKQSNGQLGIVLTLETTVKLLVQFSCTVNTWYLIQVSVAFAGALSAQVNTLAHYHIMDETGSILRGYVQITYTATISSQYGGGDSVYIGDTLNAYPDKLWIRYMRFDEGFQIFSNNACQADCTIGRSSQTPSEDYCLICDISSKLNSNFLCTLNSCSGTYYELTDMVSHNFCAFCDGAQTYYVNPSQICIQATCGNGYKEPPGENCDDGGTVAGDGCSATCLYEVGFNCAPATDYELTTCVNYCGNGVRDQVLIPIALAYTEACDDGNVVASDGCTNCVVDDDLWECGYSFPSICTLLCGNGKLNNNGALSQTEQCDDGNAVSGDGCDSTCQIEVGWVCSAVSLQMSACVLICGNGSLDAGEACDDGNVIPNDGCTNCVIDLGWDCSGTICTQYCGNGVKEVIPAKSVNEACDDGNSLQYDGCYQCAIEATWTCDASNPSKCHLCGNSKKEPYETCDDGNLINGDGCSGVCAIEPSWTCNGDSPDLCNNCGDAKKQQIEECDDGNATSNDGCTNCTIDNYYACQGGSPTTPDVCVRTCPNGIVAGSEECDDGNNTNGDGCYQCIIAMGFVCDNTVSPSVCVVDTCGNGRSHSTTEECDDGNAINEDGCDSTCKIEVGWDCSDKLHCNPICGDSKRLPIEECDDGNLIDGDGCSSMCKVELAYSCSGGSLTVKDTCIVTCGNNVRDGKEQCDDGNVRNGDGCSSLCLIETGFGCSEVLMQDNVLRDECFPCTANCALCTDVDILGCSLCYQGYYKSDTSCTNSCGDGYYPDAIVQSCLGCGTNCVKCFSSTQCYRCQSTYYLDGTSCVKKCQKGYFIAMHELKGEWCKKCPAHCTDCDSETVCTTCNDYYSPSGVCKYCDMGNLCLGCDFETNTCSKCILGYRPISDSCIKIDAKCGDGLVAATEKCDDGNLANGDGCSRSCEIESGANCRLVANEGPSECFDTVGWEFELQSFILDPQLILLTFSNSIMYDDILITDIGTLFTLTINGFTVDNDYTYKFVNNSGSNSSVYIQFTFLKNVVSQTLTVTLKETKKVVNYYDVTIDPLKTTKTIDLEDKEFYTNSQIAFFTLLRNAAYGLQIFNWILVVGAAFLDQQYRIWKTVEMLQVICALYYINVRSYPLNAEMLLVDLRYSNLYILPNFFQQHTDEYLLSLRRFSMAGLTYEVLNNTGGLFLFYLAISLVVYAFAKSVYMRYVLKVFEVFLDKLEFGYFFKFYEVFLLELLISCAHNVKFNSMASNWSGTNTIIALILMLAVILMQATQFLIAFFRDRFGTPTEVQTMFGTLTDGCQDHTRLRRIFMSQQDFIRKAFIAYAMVYVEDPFQQMLFIIIPRAVLSGVCCIIMKNWFLRGKELISELLLYGIIGIVYILAMGNFVGDLNTKVFYGQLWVYLVLAIEFLHGACNTYLVWRLLYVLESTLPEDIDPTAGLNKKIDLFKVRGHKFKGKSQKEVNDEAERKQKELEARRKKQLEDEQALKNANRERWNVWDMKREARPEEQRFISINHNEFGDELAPQPPQVPKLPLQSELINLDDLDQLDDIFGQPKAFGSTIQFGQTGKSFNQPDKSSKQINQSQQNINSFGQSQQQIKQFGQINQFRQSGTQSQFRQNTQLNQSQQVQASQINSKQQLNQSQQEPVQLMQEQFQSSNKTLNKSEIKQQSTFQFPQESPSKKAQKIDESQQEESIINDNPFDF